MRPLTKTSAALGLALAMVGTTVVTAASSAGATTCFGLTPTIVAVEGEETVGTSGADVIMGTSGPDLIYALGGDDRVCSKGGDDEVRGGAGDDRISLGAGDDIGRGGMGHDRVLGKRGKDRIFGNSGRDVLRGGSGRDNIFGGKGADELIGNSAADVLQGGPGNDMLDGGKKGDSLAGGDGADALYGRSGHDGLNGQAGIDSCFGGSGADEKTSCELPAPGGGGDGGGDGSGDDGSGDGGGDGSGDGGSGDGGGDGSGDGGSGDGGGDGSGDGGSGDGGGDGSGDGGSGDGGGDGGGGETGPVAEMSAFIQSDVVDAYPSFPWLDTAWEFVSTEGTVEIDDLPGFIAGQVWSSCSYSSGALGTCRDVVFTMDVAATTSRNTIIHELAHVYERSTGLLADPGPLGMAQLYFNIEWGDVCTPAEIFADTMLHVTKPNAYLSYYSGGCPALASTTTTPTAGAEAVVTSLMNGNDPAWFASEFANSTEVWAAVMDLSVGERLRVVTNLANEFGGYCSVSNTMITAFWGGSDTNPWADDGC